MPFWSLKKNKETPKKQGKPTEEELLKQDNCKTMTLKDGSRFILVGGTHTKGDEWEHYLHVKDFFDVLTYDVICMETPYIVESEYPAVDSKFFKELLEKIRQDKTLWDELCDLLDKIILEYPKFARFLMGDTKLLKEGDLKYCKWVLKRIGETKGFSEESRRKLGEILESHLKQQLTSEIAEIVHVWLYKPELIEGWDTHKLLLLKAVKHGKGIAFCDVLEWKMPIFFMVYTIVQVTLLFPLFFLVLLMPMQQSANTFLHPKFGKAFTNLRNLLNYFREPSDVLVGQYREALTALQLLNLGEDFKKTRNRPGNFIYWSHVGHTDGVFKNLELGSKNKKLLERKIYHPHFSFLKRWCRQYVSLETNDLPKNVSANFISAAKKAGIPVDEL